VDIWVIACAPAPRRIPPPAGFCSSEELARAGRMMAESSRNRFLLVRSAVRDILSRYISGAKPQELVFDAGLHGKPRLEEFSLHFNVSHSGSAALCAVAREELGIDLETVRPIPNLLSIAESFFTREEYKLIRRRSPAGGCGAFLQIWTRKEACSKALGYGLATPYWELSTGIGAQDEGNIVQEIQMAGRRVFLRNLPMDGKWFAALGCLGKEIGRPRFRRYRPLTES
jgi:4'-phosphopantetheinyl transferase